MLRRPGRPLRERQNRLKRRIEAGCRQIVELEPRPDQGRVWYDIAMLSSRLSVDSPAGEMDAAFRAHEARMAEYLGAFAAAEGQVGAVIAITGHVTGTELFESPHIWRKLSPKIARSWALEAIQHLETPRARAALRPRALLTAIARAGAACFPAVGAGEEVRLSGRGLTASALVSERRALHAIGFREKTRRV